MSLRDVTPCDRDADHAFVVTAERLEESDDDYKQEAREWVMDHDPTILDDICIPRFRGTSRSDTLIEDAMNGGWR